MKWITILAAIVLSAAAAGAEEDLGRRLAAEERARIAADARPLYQRHCETCHGGGGKGDGPSARFLSTPPRDFTLGQYKWRLTPFGMRARIEDLYRTISFGALGTEMPAWKGSLSPAERLLLAGYVATFSDRFVDEPEPQPIEIPAAPAADEASIARGRELFATMGCTGCHGEQGRGDGPAASALVDAKGLPIRPADLTRGFYKGGRGAAVVYRTVTTGLEGTPMGPFGAGLTPAQRWDLAHFVVSLGRPGNVLERLFAAPAGRMQTP